MFVFCSIDVEFKDSLMCRGCKRRAWCDFGVQGSKTVGEAANLATDVKRVTVTVEVGEQVASTAKVVDSNAIKAGQVVEGAGNSTAYYGVQGGVGDNTSQFRIFIDDVGDLTIGINSLNQGRTAPKIVDPSKPGCAYDFPEPWIEWLEEYGTSK